MDENESPPRTPPATTIKRKIQDSKKEIQDLMEEMDRKEHMLKNIPEGLRQLSQSQKYGNFESDYLKLRQKELPFEI